MCSFAEYNLSKVDICTNLQKKHCSGEQIFFVGMELLNNTHHIRENGFWGFASDQEIFYPKCAHLLILTDQN